MLGYLVLPEAFVSSSSSQLLARFYLHLAHALELDIISCHPPRDLLPPIALLRMSAVLLPCYFVCFFIPLKLVKTGLAFPPSSSVSTAYPSVLFTLHRPWDLFPPSYWCPPRRVISFGLALNPPVSRIYRTHVHSSCDVFSTSGGETLWRFKIKTRGVKVPSKIYTQLFFSFQL